MVTHGVESVKNYYFTLILWSTVASFMSLFWFCGTFTVWPSVTALRGPEQSVDVEVLCSSGG